MFTFPIGHFSGGAAPLLLDAFTTSGVWDLARRVLTSHTGSLCRIYKVDTADQEDFGYTAANVLDTAAIATFLGASAGRVAKIYRQDGAGDLVQATAANMPDYSASGMNGKPTALYVTSRSTYMEASIAALTPSALTFVAVHRSVSRATSRTLAVPRRAANSNDYDNNAGFLAGHQQSPTQIGIYQNNSWSDNTHPGDGSNFFFVCMNDGANVRSFVDGTAGTPTDALVPAFNVDRVLAGARWVAGATMLYLDGHLPEIFLFPSALSAGDRGTLRTDAQSFWGTP